MTSREYREDSRRRWAATAAGWEQRADWLRKVTMPVSAWMVEAIRPQPGHEVLELGAGPGDTGFLAAELIQPGGTLTTSDVVPEMLTVAQRRAQAQGIRNVRFRQIDAEVIDQRAASIDGVLCRWGYMLMADGEAALRETRRILRHGGRLALAAWTGPNDNPWSAIPFSELVSRGFAEPPDPDEPGQFAWATEGVVVEQLEAAGFVEHEVAAVAFTLPYASVDDWWDATSAVSMRFNDATARMDAATRDAIKTALAERAAEWMARDGSLALPARTWVAAATA
jgi:SAM-dependent methyltransferase